MSQSQSLRRSAYTLLACVIPLAACQSLPHTPFPAEGQSVAEMVGAQCPKFASQMVDRKEVQTILKDRPVDIPALCGCTQTRFASDARLRDELGTDRREFARKMKEPQLKAYMMLRLFTSFLECVAPEFDKALNASTPSK